MAAGAAGWGAGAAGDVRGAWPKPDNTFSYRLFTHSGGARNRYFYYSNFTGPSVLTSAKSDQIAQITAILAQLDNTPVSAGAVNRRRATRIKMRTMMSAVLLGADARPSVRIFTRNLSTSGIGFVSRRPFKEGERIALSFHIPRQSPKLVLTNITFVRYLRAGLYEVGAEFLECIEGTSSLAAIPPHWIPPMPARR